MQAKPFLKWAGGKNQLLNKIDKELPVSITRYFEPFLGGGAVLFHILKKYNPKYVFVSDINKELINTYNVLKNNPNELIKELEKHKIKHSKEHYYITRGLESRITKQLGLSLRDSSKIYYETDIKRAAKFIYLNKTCFNGLYRVNKNNKFNVPMGRYKDPQIYNKSNLLEISKLLKNTIIKAISYEKILNYVKKDDFIYLDPPYDQLNNNSFTTYTKYDFTRKDQVKLKEFYDILHKKGCKILESNSSTEAIQKLYKKYKIIQINAKRMINCDGKKRGNIKEVLIKNY